MTPDVNVVVIDFQTTKAAETITINEDGTYTILINARMSNDTQLSAYEHAIKHIMNRDFEKDNVQEIEAVAHDIKIPDTAPRIPADKYAANLRRIRRERKRLQKKIKEDQKRVKFLAENCDLFNLAEDFYLYGHDL